MNVYEYVRDLRRSGQTCEQIAKSLDDLFGIKVSTNAIFSLTRSAINKRKEYQYSDSVKLHRLTRIVTFEEFEKTCFNPQSKEFSFINAKKLYGLEYRDTNLFIYGFFNYFESDFFYYDVRQKIFEADDYTCQRCFWKEPEMETHHIMPGLGNNFENGITLCRMCHIYFHSNSATKWIPKEKYTRETWFDYAMNYKIIHNCVRLYKKIKEENISI